MASRSTENKLSYITISKKEAVDLIALLTAQLADETAPGCMSGACPEIKLLDRGVITERLVFVVGNKS